MVVVKTEDYLDKASDSLPFDILALCVYYNTRVSVIR